MRSRIIKVKHKIGPLLVSWAWRSLYKTNEELKIKRTIEAIWKIENEVGDFIWIHTSIIKRERNQVNTHEIRFQREIFHVNIIRLFHNKNKDEPIKWRRKSNQWESRIKSGSIYIYTFAYNSASHHPINPRWLKTQSNIKQTLSIELKWYCACLLP